VSLDLGFMTNTLRCTLTGLFVAAQAVAPQDLAPTVAKLVRQLDAAEKVRREEAERQLLELGPAVLSHLPAPDTGSAEVRLRIARVRTQLETRQGEQQVQASQVTISGKALPLAEVLPQSKSKQRTSSSTTAANSASRSIKNRWISTSIKLPFGPPSTSCWTGRA
jgi:hypothetical protein